MDDPLESRTLRPRDLALLWLAAGDVRPRKRARDQQADVAGLELKRRILARLAEFDPEPPQLEAALMKIVGECDPPAGPARALAAAVRDDYLAACDDPDVLDHLLASAAHEHHPPRLTRDPRDADVSEQSPRA